MTMEPYNWNEYLKYFAGLIAIVNPVGAIPLFVNMTVQQTAVQKKHTGLVASVATCIVLLVVLVTGETILRFFGIGIASFRVGGGILLLLIAISMLHAQTSPAKHTEEEAIDSSERDSVAVVPLAIPILAGPGAISTVILYAQRRSTLGHYFLLAGEIVLISLVVFVALSRLPIWREFWGKRGLTSLPGSWDSSWPPLASNSSPTASNSFSRFWHAD